VNTHFSLSSRRSLSVIFAGIGFSVFCLALAPAIALAQNTISTYAGGGSYGTTPTTLDLPAPSAAIRDTAGNTYIAAPFSTEVFKANATTVTTFAGLGYETYSGDGGLATKAGLDLPGALAIDTKGNIYISDPGGSRIREVAFSTGKIQTVVGSGTKCEPSTATCGDGGSATSTNVGLNMPNAIAIDANGNIYIADSVDQRIRVVNRTTKTITIAGVSIPAGDIQTIAGNGNMCSSPTSKCGDGGAPTSANLNFPDGIAVDSNGNIYIADSRDNRIREIANTTPATITTIAGSGLGCNSAQSPSCGDGGPLLSAQFRVPEGLFVDPNNNLYIADTFDQEIRFINFTNGSISTVAGTGVEGFSGDGAAATSAELNNPTSVFLDSAGNLVISDTGNQRVRVVTAVAAGNGNIATFAGGGTGGDGGPATSATFADPYNVAEDSAGNLYVADSANNRIRKITPGGASVSTVAGNGIAGYSGDGGPATSATLDAPTMVILNSAGNLFIADAGNGVIREVNTSTSVISTYAGNGTPCNALPPGCGDGGAATSASLSDPIAIAFDTQGNLYISDYTALRIREVFAASGSITTFAGSGNDCDNPVGKCGDFGPPTKAGLDHPAGIAVDQNNDVFIDDSQNNRVRWVPTSTVGNCLSGEICPYALNGAAHLQGDGGPALQGGMWNPQELAVDPSGNVYIGGGNESVIQRIDTSSYTIGTVAGFLPNGVGGFSGDGGPATSAKLSNYGLFVDAGSNLYIADAGNNRVRTVHLTPAGTPTPATLVFPATPLHQGSTPMAVTFESTGGVDLNLTSISFTGKDPSDFSETDNCTSLVNLGVDVTCTVNVTFTPLSYDLRVATLSFNDNGPGGAQTVSLSGYGPYFTPTMSPTSITVNPGATGTSTVTVTPYGDFNGAIGLSCKGAPANSTCSISPTSVTLNGSGAPQTATLSLVTTSSTPAGSYTLTITALFSQKGGQIQFSTTLPVTIP
jgi:sugar lactone lactonase YvrE